MILPSCGVKIIVRGVQKVAEKVTRNPLVSVPLRVGVLWPRGRERARERGERKERGRGVQIAVRVVPIVVQKSLAVSQ